MPLGGLILVETINGRCRGVTHTISGVPKLSWEWMHSTDSVGTEDLGRV